MSEMLLPPSRYTSRSQRSPGAMAAAIAINGGVIALLLALPAAQGVIETFKGPKVRFIEVPIAPRDIGPEAKVEPKPFRKSAPEKVAEDRPFIADTVVPGLGDGPPILGTTERVEATDFVLPDKPVEPARIPVIHAARLDARYADSFKPDYPAALRRDGLEGSVTVRVIIDEKGRVIAVEQLRASDPAFFEAARLHALRYWRFVPATEDGRPIQSQQTLTLQFRLEE